MKKPLVAALLLLFTLPAFAESPAEERARIETEHEQYSKLFPYYMELCGVTKWAPKKGEAGGDFGHTVMYIQGMCRDESAGAPRVKVCGPDGGGVAISMDSDYQNVYWTAVGSRNFMFYGNLAPDAPVSQKAYDDAINEAVRQHIFRGVRLLDYHVAKMRRGESYEHYVARWSIGTNFAVNFARNMYCTRIPLVASKGPKDGMIRTLVDYFNGLQYKSAREGGTGYNGVTNNCTHLAHNALAAIGFWAPKEIGWEEPGGLAWLNPHTKANISVPFNTMVDALRKGVDNSLRAGDIAGDGYERKGFYKYGFTAAQPGVTLEMIPMHTLGNEMFINTKAPHLLDADAELSKRLSFFSGGEKPNNEEPRFQATIKQAKVNSLEENLKYWQKRLPSDIRNAGSSSSGELNGQLAAYLKGLQSQVDEKLKALQELERSPTPIAAAEKPTEAAH